MIVYAEVTRVIKSDVAVRVDEFCAANAADRDSFVGSDVDYVRSCIEQDRIEYLEGSREDTFMGITITEEYDEVEVSFL